MQQFPIVGAVKYGDSCLCISWGKRYLEIRFATVLMGKHDCKKKIKIKQGRGRRQNDSGLVLAPDLQRT